MRSSTTLLGIDWAIITFNYDRSLEHYLFTALSHSYNLSESGTASIVRHISINHLHGEIGSHPAFSDDGRAYEPRVDRDTVERAARGIRVVHEQATDDANFINARLTLQNFQRVVFLGFGYDPTNVARLMVESIPKATAVYGSSRGLSHVERNTVSKLFNRHITVDDHGHEVLAFLREHLILI
jgi:hypothetical protein